MSAGTEQLKIGYLIDDSLDGHHGVGTYVRDVGEWFSMQGHQVHYIAGVTTNPPEYGTLHQPVSKRHEVRFNGNALSIPGRINKDAANELLEDLRLDVLHVQMPYSPWLAGRLISATTTERIVGTFHILPFDRKARFGSWLVGRAQKQTLRRFAHVVAPSQPAADFAQWAYNLSPRVLPNPVNVSDYAEASPLPEYDDDHVNLVFIGRLVERKGVQHALQALDQLKDVIDPAIKVRFIIGGNGSMIRELEEMASGLSDSNITVVFEDLVSNERKKRLYKTSDIAVFPATSGESFGIVLTEAMAAKHPMVIGGNNAGYSSVLQTSAAKTGLQTTLDPTDHKQFALLLKSYCESPTLRRQLQEQQSKEVDQYDIRVIGESLLRIYRP